MILLESQGWNEHIPQFYYSRLQMTVFSASAPHIRPMYAAVRFGKSNHFRSAIANSGIYSMLSGLADFCVFLGLRCLCWAGAAA